MANHLITLNERGIFPDPGESEDSFLERLATSSFVTSFSCLLAKECFDIQPNWVEIIYSNKGLLPWEGACAWLEEKKITLQFKEVLARKEKYLGFYRKEEILAHELLHAARSHFDEPIFEEILAYQTSSSCFRRYLGPLFRSSKESLFFLLSFFGVGLFSSLLGFPMIGCLLNLSLLSFPLGRLLHAQRIFSRAKRNVSQLVGEKKALFILVRLLDKEIIAFSKMKGTEILAFIKERRESDLRWKQIFYAYFPL